MAVCSVHCYPGGSLQYNTLDSSLSFFLSSSGSSVHSNLSPCLPSNLPTHPCVSVSVCVPVSLHEPLLSWLSGAQCLGGRKDHEGIRYSHINVWYWQSGPKCKPQVCSGLADDKEASLWHNQWILLLNILFYKQTKRKTQLLSYRVIFSSIIRPPLQYILNVHWHTSKNKIHYNFLTLTLLLSLCVEQPSLRLTPLEGFQT